MKKLNKNEFSHKYTEKVRTKHTTIYTSFIISHQLSKVHLLDRRTAALVLAEYGPGPRSSCYWHWCQTSSRTGRRWSLPCEPKQMKLTIQHTS